MKILTRGRILAFLAALLLVALLVTMAGCVGEEGPQGPAGPAGPQGPPGLDGENVTDLCLSCHDEEGTVSTKIYQWNLSGHGMGEAWELEGGRDNCTACHSATGFVDWVAAGAATNEIVADPDNTPIDCRGCHQIHTTYTPADFALTTTDPVTLIVPEHVQLAPPEGEDWVEREAIYDAGKSNLCANCHQSRTAPPLPTTGGVTVSALEVTHLPNTHYGPHHGPQATMIMGINGYPGSGEVSPHYSQVEDGCVTCHMTGDPTATEGGHTFTPTLEACQSCHEGLDTFDRRGVQTEVQQLLGDLGDLLIENGVMTADGVPIVGEHEEWEVGAWFNYIYTIDDGSMGVHNPFYTIELLEDSIAQLQ